MKKLTLALLLLCAAPLAAYAADPQPFTPLFANATTGATVKVTASAVPASVSGTLTLTAAKPANVIRICNNGTVLVFVRVSGETTPTATAADIPLSPVGSGFPCLIVQAPVVAGANGLAALSSTTTAADVYFTPGYGGF